MGIIHTAANGHVTVCNDSRGTSQFAYTSQNGGWSIFGLTADQCTDLSAALLAEANRQRREAADNVRLRDIHEALKLDNGAVR